MDSKKKNMLRVSKHMSTKNNQTKKLSVLEYTCPDVYQEIGDKFYNHCLYCGHLQRAKAEYKDWRCDLPNREAQRRHHAGLTEKQKVLV
jgi:uncharacterized Zn-finger protein